MIISHAFIRKLSYSLFSTGDAWASLIAASAASQFLAAIASWAAFSGLVSLGVMVGAGGAAAAAAAEAVLHGTSCASAKRIRVARPKPLARRFFMGFLSSMLNLLRVLDRIDTRRPH